MDESQARPATRLTPPEGRWQAILRPDRPNILLALGRRIGRDNVSLLAAGVAFYVFVAIPSGLAAIVSVYALMFNPIEVEQQMQAMAGLLPLDVINILSGFLTMLATKAQGGLGVRLLIGLFIALWSAQSAASSMIVALNAVYEKAETRSFLKFELSAVILALCSIVFALLSLVLFAVAPIALAWLPLPGVTKEAISLIRWPALTALVALAIAGIYRFAPAQDGTTRLWGAWGVILTTIVWIGSSALFALYVANLASYDASYGSLGAVVVLLLWLYLAAFVVLLGAELNAELEERSATATRLPERRSRA